MTNTEKLNCLTDRPCTVCKYHKENGCSKWTCVFEQEPTTKNDLGVDCISRADAIRVASGYCHPSNVAKELAKLPSVTPQEPKTGHWYRQTNDFVDYYECSECGMAMGLYDVKNYCPNCGSRNEVEE